MKQEAGVLIDYMDGEWILLLEGAYYICLNHDETPGVACKDSSLALGKKDVDYNLCEPHDWINDPYTTAAYPALRNEQEVLKWLDNEPYGYGKTAYFRQKTLEYYAELFKKAR